MSDPHASVPPERVRRVFKFSTGEPIPEGARHVATVAQTQIEVPAKRGRDMAPDGTWSEERVIRLARWEPCWLVWHYYEIESAT
jgi:hypothetical protein